MTVDQFEQLMREADQEERRGWELIKGAQAKVRKAETDAGLRHVSRDPGFACWTADWIEGYRNTPEEVMAEKPKES